VLFEFAEEDESSLNELRPLLERLEHEILQAETETLLPARMMRATLSARFTLAPVAPNRRIGPKCFCECI